MFPRKAIISVLLFLTPHAAHSAEPISSGPRQIGVTVLYELTVKEGKILINVDSGGLTGKASFKADVRKEEALQPRTPHYVVTFRRIATDDGKAIVSDGVLLAYDIEKDLGITGLYTLSVTNPVRPQSEDAELAKILRWKGLVAATAQAIDRELIRIDERLKTAKDAENARLKGQRDELRKLQAQYKEMHPADYGQLAAKPAAPEDVLTQAAGPIAPAREVTATATIRDGCHVGAELKVDGATRSGPFYHIAGIAKSVEGKLAPGNHLQLTLFLVFKRDYFGTISNYWVYVADAKVLPQKAAPAPAVPTIEGPEGWQIFKRPPADSLKIGNSEYGRIADQVQLSNQQPALSYLFFGQRPGGDGPRQGVRVFGKRQADTDWLLQDETGAVWVTGLPAPSANRPVVVHGSISQTQGGLQLKGLHLFQDAGRKGKEARTLKKGEYLFLGLSSSKSTYEEVAVKGDSVKRCFQSGEAVVFEAVTPGSTKVAVIQMWSMQGMKSETIMEFEIVVQE